MTLNNKWFIGIMKSRGKKSVIYFFKNSIGGADAFAPVATEIKFKHKDVILDLVFITEQSRHEVLASDLNERVFNMTGNVVDLSVIKGPFKKFGKLYKIIKLLVYRKFQCKKITILFPPAVRDLFGRLLLYILKIFGTVGSFPGVSIPLSSDIVKRNSGRSFRDFHICYTTDEVNYFKNMFTTDTKVFPIGLPKLFDGWQNTLDRLSPVIIENEFKKFGWDFKSSIATIVLTYPYFSWFKSEKRYFVLLMEGIVLIKKYFPGIKIILKPKVCFLYYFEEFEKDLDDPDIRLSTIALPVCAHYSKVALTINESAGIFDFIVAGVPVIEYAEYKEEWVKATGFSSAWINTPGFAYVEDFKDLELEISKASNKTFNTVTHNELDRWVGTSKDLSILCNK
jgi:hypothetical protein